MKKILIASLLALPFSQVFAGETDCKVVLKISYLANKASAKTHLKNEQAILKDATSVQSTDPATLKSVLIVNLANAIKAALVTYENSSAEPPAYLQMHKQASVASGQGARLIAQAIPIIPAVAPQKTAKEETTREQRIAAALTATVDQFRSAAKSLRFIDDPKLREALDYADKLAKIISVQRGYYGGDITLELHSPRRTMRGGPAALSFSPAASVPKGLSLTAGGAQDYGHFKLQVDNETVPSASEFDTDGFLREFDLSFVNAAAAENLLSAQSGVVYDRENRKLYVQIATTSNVTDQSFTRPPANITFAVDISGSMGATDGTSFTRLEWAKKSLNEALDEMNEDDYISIVTFDERPTTILPPTKGMANKAAIRDVIAKIDTRGMTNVGLAIQESIQHIRAVQMELGEKSDEYENRIVLLSDAGHNTGSSKDTVVNLVGAAANENIGFTAIALGENFEAGMTNKLSKMRGGNYIFVRSGEDVYKLFKRFKYLITPVVHQFNLSVELQNIKATLAKAYGLNDDPTSPIRSGQVMNVPTMFFVDTGDSGGGTILLEYDLND